jgi:hypothetical protein
MRDHYAPVRWPSDVAVQRAVPAGCASLPELWTKLSGAVNLRRVGFGPKAARA